MKNKTCKYVYGPVPSRRLGLSLGVDLVPFKTCTYDCIYCQLGGTTNKTIQRKEYLPLNQILEEISQKLETGISTDFITLAGSGEPTLHSKIGEIIDKIKQKTKIPVAVITNGSLLWDSEVQGALSRADLIVPSLDAGDAALFGNVNRPHPKISLEKMVDGQIKFSKKFSGKLWLEVFLLGGITAIEAEVKKIAAISRKIAPDKIQLNTVVRPPAENFAFPVNESQLRRYAKIMGKNTEIIPDFSYSRKAPAFSASNADIISLLRRRPCALHDVAGGLGIPNNEALKHLESLRNNNVVAIRQIGNKELYVLLKTKNKKEVVNA